MSRDMTTPLTLPGASPPLILLSRFRPLDFSTWQRAEMEVLKVMGASSALIRALRVFLPGPLFVVITRIPVKPVLSQKLSKSPALTHALFRLEPTNSLFQPRLSGE